MAPAQGETIGQWLERLAVADSCTDLDCTKMQNLLRRVGFSQAAVMLGVVYPEGQGTTEFPPISINFMAKVLVKKNKSLSK